jgi:alpha-tubulin suppressor-like RCC1 family protein
MNFLFKEEQMLSRRTLLIVIVLSFLISNISLASMCARLKSVSAGEKHSLALMDDKTLWACGRNNYWQLGIGSTSNFFVDFF